MCPAHHHNIKKSQYLENTLDFSRAVEYMGKNTALKQGSPVDKCQFLELLHDLEKTI